MATCRLEGVTCRDGGRDNTLISETDLRELARDGSRDLSLLSGSSGTGPWDISVMLRWGMVEARDEEREGGRGMWCWSEEGAGVGGRPHPLSHSDSSKSRDPISSSSSQSDRSYTA